MFNTQWVYDSYDVSSGMTVLNKSKWKGGTLQIETAKESFLTRYNVVGLTEVFLLLEQMLKCLFSNQFSPKTFQPF